MPRPDQSRAVALPGDGVGKLVERSQDDIMQWRAALNDTGRQIWLNLSNKLSLTAISTWQHYSNAWRIENDVECYCSTDTNWAHVVREINGLPLSRSMVAPVTGTILTCSRSVMAE